ncbi:uncharacterized protein [Watersipora subatra]|uniref:uncharacterized protein n=1 Tax=Watersipora subatra TaxID=2589382 RepID=UPI00355B22E4
MKLFIVVVALSAIELINAQESVNCNLQTGDGCDVNGPYFFFTPQASSPGTSSDCRRNYQLRVELPGGPNGFECYFVTNNPQSNRYIYTISHDSANYAASGTAYVEQYGSDTTIAPELASSSSTYGFNFYSYSDAHKQFGSSWTYYNFRKDHLSFYYPFPAHYFEVGHPNFFEPNERPTYIGLNRRYESGASRGKGLCQVSCQVTTTTPTFLASSAGASLRAGSPSSSSSNSRGRPGANVSIAPPPAQA